MPASYTVFEHRLDFNFRTIVVARPQEPLTKLWRFYHGQSHGFPPNPSFVLSRKQVREESPGRRHLATCHFLG